jgi:very-short-patch-repair endonuclease
MKVERPPEGGGGTGGGGYRPLPTALATHSTDDKFAFADKMRAKPTRTEAALWERVMDRQLGRPFLRQWLVLGYIVDFICPAVGLVVEVDGWDHRSSAYGRTRDRVLARAGYDVVHVPAHAVLHDIEGVIALVRERMYR